MNHHKLDYFQIKPKFMMIFMTIPSYNIKIFFQDTQVGVVLILQSFTPCCNTITRTRMRVLCTKWVIHMDCMCAYLGISIQQQGNVKVRLQWERAALEFISRADNIRKFHHFLNHYRY